MQFIPEDFVLNLIIRHDLKNGIYYSDVELIYNLLKMKNNPRG